MSYRDKDRGLDPERDRESDPDRDLEIERREPLNLGDLLQNNLTPSFK